MATGAFPTLRLHTRTRLAFTRPFQAPCPERITPALHSRRARLRFPHCALPCRAAPRFWGQITTTEHRERLLLLASEVAFALEKDRRGALRRVRVTPRRDREHEARAGANCPLLQEVLREAAAADSPFEDFPLKTMLNIPCRKASETARRTRMQQIRTKRSRHCQGARINGNALQDYNARAEQSGRGKRLSVSGCIQRGPILAHVWESGFHGKKQKTLKACIFLQLS